MRSTARAACAGSWICWASGRGRGDLADAVAERVSAKLAVEAIEDLRIDFEDGFGDRGDAAEDAAVIAAARELVRAEAQGTATPFAGIRIKCLEEATRRRGVRTLALFVAELVAGRAAAGAPRALPDGFVVTLAKVTAPQQVEAMARACEHVEDANGLEPGTLRFEVQVETPQALLAADGTATVARLVHAAPGRVTALHYGTYDYSASLGIAAAYQSMEHPAADHAKSVMQLAVAGTGVRLSDGSTNVLPVGDPRPSTRRGACTDGSCAARSSVATTRAGTCTPRSSRAGSPRPTCSTARGGVGARAPRGVRRVRARRRGRPRRAGHREGDGLVPRPRRRLRRAHRGRGPHRDRARPRRARRGPRLRARAAARRGLSARPPHPSAGRRGTAAGPAHDLRGATP